MNILITGASRGIGAETAIKLAETGTHQLILISRNYQRIRELSKKIESVNKNCSIYLFPVDLSSEQEIKELCQRLSDEFQHIDILINNAGFLVNKPFREFSSHEIRQMVMINYLAPAMLIRELFSLLNRSEHGHVINIGSMGGVQGSQKFPGLSFYSSAKGALAVLTECLAEEFKETKIKINCLSLGSADTEMLREAFPGYRPPLTAREMAGFIAGFALTGHKFFNGKILPVSLTSP